MDLPIYRVKPDDDNNTNFKNVNSKLPQSAFIMSILGGCGSGKTNLLANLLFNNAFYRGVFEEIYLFSPTGLIDSSLSPFRRNTENTVIITDNLENLHEYLNDIIEGIKEIPKKERHQTCIVLDDCLGYLRNKGLDSILSRHRHYNLTFFILTQNYRSLSAVIRSLTNIWCIFGLSSKKERLKLLEEFASNFPGFEKAYSHATSEPRGFLVCDLKNKKMFNSYKSELNYSDD